MKKITIRFKLNGQDVTRVAVLTDDLCEVIKNHPENQAADVTTGIASELGVWNIHFQTRRHEYCCDFMATVDNEGNETLLLDPCEVLAWDRNGHSVHNEQIPFTIEVTDL